MVGGSLQGKKTSTFLNLALTVPEKQFMSCDEAFFIRQTSWFNRYCLPFRGGRQGRRNDRKVNVPNCRDCDENLLGKASTDNRQRLLLKYFK